MVQAIEGTSVRKAAPARRGRLRHFWRVLRFCLRFGPLMLATQAERRRRGGGDAEDFVRELQALGPTFVKIGQLLSIRSDLLEPRYLAALSRLQDDVEPVPFEDIRAVVEAELGCSITVAFAAFGPVPIAAASLAQVHAATTHAGEDVVVKVQRPGIKAAIDDDLHTLHVIARLADRWTESGRRLHFAGWVDAMGDTLAEELDYEVEADNLRVFASHLQGHPALFVPRPFPRLGSSRVLTMERVHGTRIPELAIADEDAANRATQLVQAYLEQIFVHGLVHADPHPGNVLLAADGRLALIDFGMVARLGPQIRSALLKLLCAAVEGDGERVAEIAAQLGERLGVYDELAWQRACTRVVGRYAMQSDGSAYPEGALMLDLTRLAGQCGLRPPAEIALLGKALLNLDGLCRLIDPRVSMRRIVREHAGSLARMRMQKRFAPTTLAAEAVNTVDFFGELPRQAHEILEHIAQNRVRIRLSGLEESRLLENLQKIANRIAAGLICAAMIVGAALALRTGEGPQLLGYPALALLLFLGAFLLGAGVVLIALRTDRRMSRYERRKR
ncbi:MAG: AarF/ABC1/UbiB kinase family protein [Xanthomonadales bacterium]|nr:AarF/ABC1/UbiB kinase family protein [Xanthomonadales bacterium]